MSFSLHMGSRADNFQIAEYLYITGRRKENFYKVEKFSDDAI